MLKEEAVTQALLTTHSDASPQETTEAVAQLASAGT